MKEGKIMQINNRQEDLTKVFDRTWKANHNDDVKKAREKEKIFIDKLFNVKTPLEKKEAPKPLTPNEQVNNLQRNMNGMNSFNNQIKLNNIRGKFN